ncbi:hypothetical protein HELRODRAFT_134508, partial [Helobdella robusta]|uniref:Adenosine deaminase domain-containing protein n=1 Tax=Helobdella robusta TaxID=6412 RepID=T1EI50_HELRO
KITKQIKEKYPSFIDYKRISYTVRVLNYELFEKNMNLAVQLHTKYPQHLIGFDAVAEEDQGYSTLHYISQYLSLQKNGVKIIPLYLHAAETSWPDDLITGPFEDDPVSTLQNAYEAVLLNVKRIGHGKGFVKKPYLMQLLKKMKIAVEVCVISNQILGMDADLRNHFGQILYKNGVPIILSPDDPGTFGYDNFTTDWYQAYTGWGLNLGDLKQLAVNSLTYNGMTDEERKIAIEQKWRPSWEAFVNEVSNE